VEERVTLFIIEGSKLGFVLGSTECSVVGTPEILSVGTTDDSGVDIRVGSLDCSTVGTNELCVGNGIIEGLAESVTLLKLGVVLGSTECSAVGTSE
jgi:hypothetical protein